MTSEAGSAGKTEKPLQALDQQRAKKAWAQISAVPDAKGKEYFSAVRKAPAMIKMNGLGPTLAFLLAKEKKDAESLQRKAINELGADGLLYKHLEEWLIGQEAGEARASTVQDPDVQKLRAFVPWSHTDKRTLIGRLLGEDSGVYRQATQEALIYLGWLKRFAEARFGEKSREAEG